MYQHQDCQHDMIIDIDNSNTDSAFVQGDVEAISDGQKVVIIYGEDVRVLPFEE